jgi:hypothetical protein
MAIIHNLREYSTFIGIFCKFSIEILHNLHSFAVAFLARTILREAWSAPDHGFANDPCEFICNKLSLKTNPKLFSIGIVFPPVTTLFTVNWW